MMAKTKAEAGATRKKVFDQRKIRDSFHLQIYTGFKYKTDSPWLYI